MYLTQGVSALLFTIIRLVLQASFLFLLSHLASRTRNLTYQERINGGFLSSIYYLVFTRFSSGREHYLGRFYVALALVLTLALNYLPTLLSDLYPVQPTFLPSNLQPLDISTSFVKTTAMEPNNTSVEKILFGIGVPLNGSIFNSYVAPAAERLPCKQINTVMNCTNESFQFSGLYYDFSFVVDPQFGAESQPLLLNGTTPTGERFQYYNATGGNGISNLVDIFVKAGQAEAKGYIDMSFPSPRSLEGCLTKNYGDHRCVRHSLGYLLSGELHLFLITRRAYTLTIQRTLSQTFNDTIPDFVDPRVNTTLDCSKLPTLTLETMCTQINSLGAPPMYRLFTMQQQSTDENGRVHWDVVSTRVDLMLQDGWVNNNMIITLEAFHLDAGAEYYFNTVDKNKTKAAINGDFVALAKFMGRETFEATYFVPKKTVDFSNHSWIDWGFSQEDIHNLTSFLLGGTVLNSGTIILQVPELLANVSNIAVILLFVVSVLMVALGWFLSRGVDPLVREPITEVLPKILASRRPDSLNKTRTPLSLRYRHVAHLTLQPSDTLTSIEQAGPSAFTYAQAPNSSHSQDAGANSRANVVYKTKGPLLCMEIDSDDDLDVMQLFEPGEKGHAPTLSSTQGQSSHSANPETTASGRHSITTSTFP